MRTLFLILTFAAASGCARAEQAAPDRRTGCDAANATSLVGTANDAGLADRARRLSGAKAVRVIRPGDAVTMDYRADRLNVEVDRDGRVTAVRCG